MTTLITIALICFVVGNITGAFGVLALLAQWNKFNNPTEPARPVQGYEYLPTGTEEMQ